MVSLLFLLASFTPHSEAWELTALGGLNFASPTQITNGAKQSWEGTGSFSYGFFVSNSISDLPFSWETGFLFETSKYERTGAVGQQLEDNLLPVLIHFHFDAFVQLGAGYYVSWSRNPPPNSLTKQDNGLVVNLRARFHPVSLFSLILDGRYQHGLANRSPIASDTYNTRSVQVLGGLEFSL